VSRAARALAVGGALLATAPALAAKRPLAPGERIDLNRAGVPELMRLPGVGERRAKDIVAHRARQPFRRPEDVLEVKGVGPAWFAKVKGHLTVGGTAPAVGGAATPAGAPPAAVPAAVPGAPPGARPSGPPAPSAAPAAPAAASPARASR
jgi:competence protein ComEA